MSTTAFSLTYEGEALEAGQMNVEELAPALLAIGKLMEEANRIANGREVRLSVQVSAEFEKGSFLINLAADQAFIAHIAGLFSPTNLKAARDLLEFLLGSGGVIGVLRLLKGRKPAAVEKTNSGVSIRADNGSTVVFAPTVYELYQNGEIRNSVYPLIKPLERTGIDTLDVKSGAKLIQRFDKSDLQSILPPDEEEILHESTYETTLRIVAISFQEENKWRLSDGKTTYYYSIEDKEFLKKVDQNEAFTKDDLLKVRVHLVVRRMVGGEIKTDHTVVEVLEHLPGPKQARLQSGPEQ